jgi:pimeloyl-ACP methyl ester carboxylesterase
MFFLQYKSLYPVLLTGTKSFIKSSKKENIDVNYLNIDNQKIKTIYLKGKKDLPVVIYFHGNNDLIDHNVYYLKTILNNEGIGVLFVEYNGYGDSEGLPTLNKTNKAVLNALNYYNLNDKEKVVWGRSIGSAHAFDFTLNHPDKVDKLMILSGFFSPVNILTKDSSYVDWLDNIMFFNYNVKNKIKKYKAKKTIPTMLMHGDKDGLFSVEVVKELVNVLPSSQFKISTIIFSGTHNTVNIKNEEYIKFILGEQRYNEKIIKENNFFNKFYFFKDIKYLLK